MWAVESLEICTFMGFFCPKHIRFRWKSAEELCLMKLKSDAKFEEKLVAVNRATQDTSKKAQGNINF